MRRWLWRGLGAPDLVAWAVGSKRWLATHGWAALSNEICIVFEAFARKTRGGEVRFNARQAFNAVRLHTHRHHVSEGFEIDQTDIATTTIRLIAIPEFTALCALAGR
ncbi:MAG: hypothetical protein QF801_05810, partial [Alphaproteobacteria bacterium]|nr:hypothetical protein [Alphaproteobacteria bacterium]